MRSDTAIAPQGFCCTDLSRGDKRKGSLREGPLTRCMKGTVSMHLLIGRSQHEAEASVRPQLCGCHLQGHSNELQQHSS